MATIEFTKHLQNKLHETFEVRAKKFNLRKRKFIAAQLNFFMGAVAAIDALNNAKKSCIPRNIFYCEKLNLKIEKTFQSEITPRQTLLAPTPPSPPKVLSVKLIIEFDLNSVSDPTFEYLYNFILWREGLSQVINLNQAKNHVDDYTNLIHHLTIKKEVTQLYELACANGSFLIRLINLSKGV